MSTNLNRRQLIGAGLAGGLALTSTATLPSLADESSETDLFTLGVASGDPLPDSVVLWTRLCRSPLAPDGLGGMAARRYPVRWEVAEDDAFRRVVRRGSTVAAPSWAHSVHVEVDGLRPGRDYWFRFRAGRQLSPVGHTRTAPGYDADPAALAFAFTSCQNYPAGYFTALRHMAQDDLDVVLHLGDYIYEGGGGGALGRAHAPASETFGLADYRVRHSQYKTDPDLQALHAAHAMISVPDDHEVENNWAGDISQVDTEPDQDPAVFRQRRAAAFKAMYENMPYRRAQLPDGPDMRLYRRVRYGRLLDFSMIDTRQYRDDQLEDCVGDCEARRDPGRTMLGEAQERWLVDGLADPGAARWKVVGNQGISFEADRVAGPGVAYSQDNWGGYAGARQSLYDQVHEAGVENLVVVTGDAHRNASAELKLDFADQSSPTIGTEFLGTSVSSGGDGGDQSALTRTWLAENPHIKFANDQRGYQRVRVSRETLEVDYRVLEYVTRPGSPVSTRETMVVESGRPGIVAGGRV
ncbi:alkaline phosphatase [Auraticoccus sp. F435]|uniref:Alkaline phosphatase n=1 Tax=Auraticoccus cholistanensis TaxID=2656650 RepID=A0A6A9UTB7_9ACTN|nr:alkaline phosphatase D family protein [Auraticoccus cholistanensis]MVA75888.1 alkaline phosphatase [Auraticoccus cholistanensis]